MSYEAVVLTDTWLFSVNELRPLFAVARSQYAAVRCDRKDKTGGGVILILKKHCD